MKFEDFYNTLAMGTVVNIWEEAELIYSEYHSKNVWKLGPVIDVIKGYNPSNLEINNRKIVSLSVDNLEGILMVTLEAEHR